MAGQWADGFDSTSTSLLSRDYTVTQTNATVTVTGSAARNGSNGVRFTNNSGGVTGTGSIKRTLSASKSTLVQGHSFNLSALPGASRTVVLHGYIDATTTQVDIRVNPAGNLVATRNGTTLGTSSNSVVAGTKYYVESKVTFSNTGSIDVYINGTNWLSLSSVDTTATANSSANIIQLGGLCEQTASWTHDADDWYCDDANVLGDSKVVDERPTGAGNYSQWTPSAGSNYQNVDDTTSDDASTDNSTGTSGNIDTFTMGQLSGTNTIHFILWMIAADKDDAGARTIAPLIRISSTDYAGSNVSPSQNSWANFYQVYDADPSTSSAWTQSGANGAEWGYKCTA